MEFLRIFTGVFITIYLLAGCGTPKVLSDTGLDRSDSGRLLKEYQHNYTGCGVIVTEYENFAEVSLSPKCPDGTKIVVMSKTKSQEIQGNSRFLFYKSDIVYYSYYEPNHSIPNVWHRKIWPFGVQ